MEVLDLLYIIHQREKEEKFCSFKIRLERMLEDWIPYNVIIEGSQWNAEIKLHTKRETEKIEVCYWTRRKLSKCWLLNSLHLIYKYVEKHVLYYLSDEKKWKTKFALNRLCVGGLDFLHYVYCK